MMKIGPVNPMAVVSASPKWGRAANQNISPKVCTAPRQSWPGKLTGQ